MDETDIILLDYVLTSRMGSSSLYYYQGNFFCTSFMHHKEEGRVRRAIAQFKVNHAKRIERDRADPDYKNLIQLYTDQMVKFAET